MTIKYMDLNVLKHYHQCLMNYIDNLVVNRAFEYTNCPNCGAIITGDECEFCGTVFKKIKKKNGVPDFGNPRLENEL